MKKILAGLVVLSGAVYAQQKFVCVDANRILQESKTVKQAEQELRAKVQDYQRQLDQISKKLEELKKQIESQAISQQVREQKIKEYQQTQAKGIEIQQKAQKEITELKEKLEGDILSKVRLIAEDMAKKNGYAGVLDCGAFVYRSPDMDVTEEVIRKLDVGK